MESYICKHLGVNDLAERRVCKAELIQHGGIDPINDLNKPKVAKRDVPARKDTECFLR